MYQVPEYVPVLSAGRHRSPRSGGCFMEIASFLAGARWSDHPKCADPSLSELARCVNDVMPDDHRSQLAVMIPSVIGTGQRRSTRERALLGAVVVRSCTLRALPLVDEKSVPIACALIGAERVLGERTAAAEAVLTTQPAAAATAESWAREYAGTWGRAGTYVALAVPLSIKLTVKSVSDELGRDAWPLLTDMLRDTISEVRVRCGLEQTEQVSPDQRWDDVGTLLGATPHVPV
jgi:hypothetical protein